MLDLDRAQELIAAQSNDGPMPWDVILDYVIIQAKEANEKEAEIERLKGDVQRARAEAGLQKDFVKLTLAGTEDCIIHIDPLEITAIVGEKEPMLILREETWQVEQPAAAIIEAMDARVIEVKP